MANKSSLPLAPAPSQEEVVDKDLVLESKSLEQQARENLDPDLLIKVKKISYYTSENGLTLEEACMLADINLEYFKELLETNPLIFKIIEIKKLQYKKDLLYTISQKAREGDDKLALWLLERMYPEEFYISKKRPPGEREGDEDMVVQAIQFVQEHGDSSPMVKRTTGKAIIIKKSGRGGNGLVKRLSDILN